MISHPWASFLGEGCADVRREARMESWPADTGLSSALVIDCRASRDDWLPRGVTALWECDGDEQDIRSSPLILPPSVGARTPSSPLAIRVNIYVCEYEFLLVCAIACGVRISAHFSSPRSSPRLSLCRFKTAPGYELALRCFINDYCPLSSRPL